MSHEEAWMTAYGTSVIRRSTFTSSAGKYRGMTSTVIVRHKAQQNKQQK
jgi:hypothetical protein